MMWHWNSWWEPRTDATRLQQASSQAPVSEPPAWHGPWGVETLAAWQARHWEHMLTASRSVWSFWLAALPAPTWPAIGQLSPPSAPHQVQPEAPDAPVARAAPPARKSPPRKRSAQPDGRHSLQTRKR